MCSSRTMGSDDLREYVPGTCKGRSQDLRAAWNSMCVSITISERWKFGTSERVYQAVEYAEAGWGTAIRIPNCCSYLPPWLLSGSSISNAVCISYCVKNACIPSVIAPQKFCIKIRGNRKHTCCSRHLHIYSSYSFWCDIMAQNVSSILVIFCRSRRVDWPFRSLVNDLQVPRPCKCCQ